MDPMRTSSPLRILLVEDSEDDRVAFRRAFRKSLVPSEITECAQAEEALKRIRTNASSFDLLVVDHGLPGMSGLDLCQELLDEEIPLPMVLLTGQGSEQLAVTALKAGVDDYMMKDPVQGYLNLLPLLLPGVVRSHSDRLARKRAEEELRKINEELNNFIHIVSHDLKNPISLIQGFSSLLLEKYQEKLDEKGRTGLKRIEASARRMEVLVSDLLTLARLGHVVYSFEDVPSLELVKEVTSGLQDRLVANGIELVVADNLPTIYCDGNKIYQVFENLLVNAIKFKRQTQNPRIEIVYQDKEGFHQFCIRDNGIGINPKYQRKIFEKFSRLREKEDEEGTGLGLTIVDRIVSHHGGKVWVKSEKGKGATFYFTLPKAP